MVVLQLDCDNLPSLDSSLMSMYHVWLFSCLCVNVKLHKHCNLCFIGFCIPFFSPGDVPFFLYAVSLLLLTVMTCVCLIPLRPSLSKCVLNSNVCGFLPMVFMKKQQKQRHRQDKATFGVVFRDGWWLVWQVITM